MNIEIVPANLRFQPHATALVELLASYADGPGGQSEPLSSNARDHLVEGLLRHPMAFVLLAIVGSDPVGAAVCFECFSTFAAKPSVNLHDLVVHPDWQGRGIGSRLLEAVEQAARQRGACKVTLEVQNENEAAKRLYARHGYGPWNPGVAFATKKLSSGSP